MREPHHYVSRDGREQHCVVWYENGERKRRTFSDANEAEVFYQQKLLGAVDKNDLILKEVTTLRKYVISGKIAEVEAENARLRDELAAVAKRLRTEETRRNGKALGAKPTSGQSINFRAFLWAYEQDALSVTSKAVLVTFAMHANQHGYTWPGVDRIAFTWGMDRDTVRRQIEELLVRRKIYPTKKRCGATKQVKVYRLPKNTYESGGKSPLFASDESEAKARVKRGTSGGKSAPNKEQGNKETHAVVDENFRLAVMTAATTATDFLDLINKLQLQFPNHNVTSEYQHFSEWRDHRGLPKVPSKFATWMLRAEKPIKRPTIAKAEADPPEFSDWFARTYPDKTSPAWAEAPDWLKNEFRDWKKTGAMPRETTPPACA
jgi:hypothetical protein